MIISLDRRSGRVGCVDNCTSGRACSRVNGFFAYRRNRRRQKISFWTNPARPSRDGGAREAAAGAFALQLLAKSDRLHKGGCALKRLSEDFRICHGRGRLDQGAFRDWPMSRAVHLFYRLLTDLRLRRERLRKREAGAPVDRRPQRMRPDYSRDYRIARAAFACRPAPPVSVASWRRHAGDRGLCQNSTLSR
jgi:hypothetical protein